MTLVVCPPTIAAVHVLPPTGRPQPYGPPVLLRCTSQEVMTLRCSCWHRRPITTHHGTAGSGLSSSGGTMGFHLTTEKSWRRRSAARCRGCRPGRTRTCGLQRALPAGGPVEERQAAARAHGDRTCLRVVGLRTNSLPGADTPHQSLYGWVIHDARHRGRPVTDWGLTRPALHPDDAGTGAPPAALHGAAPPRIGVRRPRAEAANHTP